MDVLINLVNTTASQIEIWLQSPLIKTLHFISLCLTIFLLPIFILLIIKTNKITDAVEKYKTFWIGGKYEKRRVLKIWKEINNLLDKKDLYSMRSAFLLLNEVLEEVVNRMNCQGENLIEKVKSLRTAELNETEKTKILVGVYAYEKMKADPTFNLEAKEVKYFVKVYKEFFDRLSILDD